MLLFIMFICLLFSILFIVREGENILRKVSFVVLITSVLLSILLLNHATFGGMNNDIEFLSIFVFSASSIFEKVEILFCISLVAMTVYIFSNKNQ